MSIGNSSLALEVKEELMEPEFDLHLHSKHLSISDALDEQPARHVVKVKGSITVSF